MGGAAKNVGQGFQNFGSFFDPSPDGAIAKLDRGYENSVLGQYGYKADPLNKPLMAPDAPTKSPALEEQLSKLAEFRFAEMQRAGKGGVWKIDPNEKFTLGDTATLKGY